MIMSSINNEVFPNWLLVYSLVTNSFMLFKPNSFKIQTGMPRSKSRKCKEMIVWAFMELKPGLAQSRKKVISFRHFFQKEHF